MVKTCGAGPVAKRGVLGRGIENADTSERSHLRSARTEKNRFQRFITQIAISSAECLNPQDGKTGPRGELSKELTGDRN